MTTHQFSKPQIKGVLAQELPQTPFYFYDENILRALSASFQEAISSDPDIHLHYAMKANSSQAVLKVLKEYGAGLDIVSGEEMKVGLQAGFRPDQIVYSGVGKSEEELRASIENEISVILVESREEFLELCTLAADYPQKKVRIGFRFNPNLNVETHPYIATGLWDHKFGMADEEILSLLALSRPQNLSVECLSIHLGSQIFQDKVFYDALGEVLRLARVIVEKFSLRFPILDVGGGLGVNYEKPFQKPDFESYGKFLKKALLEWKKFNPGLSCKVYSECGRALVSQAGFLVTKVIRVKRNPKKNFAIVDASMTELIRPALYNALHVIEKLSGVQGEGKSAEPSERYDVVGPVCESGDFLAQNIELPMLQKGDLLWVTCAGAYGFAMSNSYNMRPLPAEYLLKKEGSWELLHGPVKVWNKL